MPDFTIPIALLRKPIEYVFDAASGAVKTKLKKLKADGKAESLHSKLWQIQRIKTIWNPDRPLALSTIFFPVQISYEIEGTHITRRVESLNDLHHRNCLVQGTAGQGKSILLKYLVGKEIRSGERVPLLYELRNYYGGDLSEVLAGKFCEFLGIPCDKEIWEAFCEKLAVSVLLDGLDEVDPQHSPELLQGIERLSQRFLGLRIVLSTRPESGGEFLSQFSAVRIEPLSREALPEFLKRITKDEAFTKKLTSALRSSPVGVQHIVKTPLAATLLAIIYRAAGRIPAEFTEFFEELFHVLVARHDASKLGWRRLRSSGLSDRQLQYAFEAYCFQVRRRKTFSCTLEEAENFAAEGLQHAEIQASADNVLKDVRKVTCLIVQEGRRMEFVHTSVANYFAAKYVKLLAHDAAYKFYTHLLGKNWQQWLAELEFLKDIDQVRFTEAFLLPDIDSALGRLDAKDGIKLTADTILSNGVLIRRQDPAGEFKFYAEHNYSSPSYSERSFSSLLFKKLFEENYESVPQWARCEAVKAMKDDDRITWLHVAKSRGIVQNIISELELRRWTLETQRNELAGLVARSKGSEFILTI